MYDKFDERSVEGGEDGERELIGNQEEMQRLKEHAEDLQQDCDELVRKTEVCAILGLIQSPVDGIVGSPQCIDHQVWCLTSMKSTIHMLIV